jgi:predicted XRE-type DNA-binding protein
LLLLDGLRQVEAAERLGIARPTVSVLAERAHVREIAGLADALRTLFVQGIDRASIAAVGAA